MLKYLRTIDKSHYNRSDYNKRAREVAEFAVRYLILFCQRQPEDEVAKIFHGRVANDLAAALEGKGCPRITKRHYDIANTLVNVGVTRIMELVPPNYQYLLVSEINRALLPAQASNPQPRENANLEFEREDAEKVLREEFAKLTREASS